jgi:hypothetical protein
MYFRAPAGWHREGEGLKAGLQAPGNDQVVIMLSPSLPASMPANAGVSEFSNWEQALNRSDPQAGARRETLKSPNGQEVQRMRARVREPGGSRWSTVFEGWKVGQRTHLFVYAAPNDELLRRYWDSIEKFRRSVWFDTGTPLALPAASPGPLEGLFGGKYFFSRFGRVLIVTDRADITDVPGGVDEVTLGSYQIAGGVIRLHLLDGLAILPDQRFLVCRKLTENDCREKVEEYPFSASNDYKTITLGKVAYVRDKDETGRKLSGKFKLNETRYEAAQTVHQAGSLQFTPDGQFSLDENWDVQGKIEGMFYVGSRKGSGHYVIRGHELILQGPIQRDGAGGDAVEAGNFESAAVTLSLAFVDRGRDGKGRSRIQFGANIYTEGDDAPATVKGLGPPPR